MCHALIWMNFPFPMTCMPDKNWNIISYDRNLNTTVYRKPMHTDRLLDESSYNPTSHKATTKKTLTRRAQLVCDSLRDENRYLDRVFHKNNYNADFIRRNIFRPNEADATNRNPAPDTTVTIPYVKGTSETISRILQPYNIGVAYKPTTTLHGDACWLTWKTGTNLTTDREQFIRSNAPTIRLPTLVRLAETLTQERATRNGDANNHLAVHHQLTKHNIDWNSAQCLTCSTNYFQRLNRRAGTLT